MAAIRGAANEGKQDREREKAAKKAAFDSEYDVGAFDRCRPFDACINNSVLAVELRTISGAGLDYERCRCAAHSGPGLLFVGAALWSHSWRNLLPTTTACLALGKPHQL